MSAKATRPFSIGYAYAQTEHYKAEAARLAAEAAAALPDPFDAIEDDPFAEAEQAPSIPAQRPAPAAPLATDAQVGYAMSLVRRNLGEVTAELAEAAEARFRAMSKREISEVIGKLKAIPPAPKKAIPPAPKKAAAPSVTEGMYWDPATGDIFKVQVAHHGSGNLYAKKLVKLEVSRVKRGKEYSHDFEYAPGAIRTIQPEWRMTREQAAEWGRLYGACCKCGTILTDEKSIAAGIGPICSRGF